MQLEANPVVVYETKPATEWLLGGPVQKVSPRYAHSVMQRELGTAVSRWAKGRGRVGPEWRVWVAPPGESERYLVPDLMYVAYERLARESREAAEEPHVVPDAVFEIRSKSDRHIIVNHKVDVYLRAGTGLVVIVDPYERTVVLHDADAMRILRAGDRLEHPALPGFALDLDELFAELDD
ncbi:MAG: Uma2 family endonuclease [Vulcanimicrobiaceae bacterium]